MTAIEYGTAEVECQSTGSAPITYVWEKLNGELSYDVDVQGGYLRFGSIRKSDEGEYRCSAANSYGDDTQILRVYVRSEQRPPTAGPPVYPIHIVEISPPSFNGRPGDEVRLNCNSQPQGTLVWSKDGLHSLPYNVDVRGAVLIISSARTEDSGRYVCTSTASNAAPATSSAQVVIGSNLQPPKIKAFNEQYNIIQGHDFTLNCEGSGNPMPRMKWTRAHESFNDNTQQNGNSLRILNADVANRGVYICIADSDHGSDQASIIIEVERKWNSTF